MKKIGDQIHSKTKFHFVNQKLSELNQKQNHKSNNHKSRRKEKFKVIINFEMHINLSNFIIKLFKMRKK